MTYDKDELKRSRMSDAVTVTPEQATAFLEAPYDDLVDGRIADDMAATIEGMRWEYYLQRRINEPVCDVWETISVGPDPAVLRWGATNLYVGRETRIIRRMVGPVDTVEESGP